MNILRSIRARLIADWCKAWKYWSVQITTFGAALMFVWPLLPADVLMNLPYARHVAGGLFLLILIARFTSQEKPNA